MWSQRNAVVDPNGKNPTNPTKSWPNTDSLEKHTDIPPSSTPLYNMTCFLFYTLIWLDLLFNDTMIQMTNWSPQNQMLAGVGDALHLAKAIKARHYCLLSHDHIFHPQLWSIKTITRQQKGLKCVLSYLGQKEGIDINPLFRMANPTFNFPTSFNFIHTKCGRNNWWLHGPSLPRRCLAVKAKAALRLPVSQTDIPELVSACLL